jgi:hypothetical protein
LLVLDALVRFLLFFPGKVVVAELDFVSELRVRRGEQGELFPGLLTRAFEIVNIYYVPRVDWHGGRGKWRVLVVTWLGFAQRGYSLWLLLFAHYRYFSTTKSL